MWSNNGGGPSVEVVFKTGVIVEMVLFDVLVEKKIKIKKQTSDQQQQQQQTMPLCKDTLQRFSSCFPESFLSSTVQSTSNITL